MATIAGINLSSPRVLAKATYSPRAHPIKAPYLNQPWKRSTQIGHKRMHIQPLRAAPDQKSEEVEDSIKSAEKAFPDVGKDSWPELLGENGEVAAAKIEKENGNVHAIIILEGTPMTLAFRFDRVRVIVNENEKVTQVPRIG